jgi:hypothetical protein
MRIPETIPAGSEVYYFDAVLQGDMPIIKSLVLGYFLHKQEGELYYCLLNKQVPAYTVASTLEGARQQRAAFEEYRKILLKANEDTKKELNKLKEGKMFAEYSVDVLPSEEKAEVQDEQSEITEINE